MNKQQSDIYKLATLISIIISIIYSTTTDMNLGYKMMKFVFLEDDQNLTWKGAIAFILLISYLICNFIAYLYIKTKKEIKHRTNESN